MRMFIGAPLSRRVRKNIIRAVDGMAGALGCGVVPPENLHITLSFLGEVDEARIADISKVLDSAVQGMAPVRIATGNTGWFGGSLLYLSVAEGADALARIKDRLDEGLSRIGLSFDKKPFRAHITLARRVPKQMQVDIPQAQYDLGEIMLYKSERINHRQVYTPVAQAAFSQGRLIVDRFEGGFAVCENLGGGMVRVPLSLLPFQAAEGMVIYNRGGSISLLENEGLKHFEKD